MTNYFAHSTDDSSKADWQPLQHHLAEVSRLAGLRGAKFQASALAELAGLLHDLGKYTAGFQRRLSGGASLDHATAGAREVPKLAQRGDDRLMAELAAYAIAGHHSGLPDKEGGDGCLSERIQRDPSEDCDPLWRSELTPSATNLTPAFRWSKGKEKAALQIGVLGRMVFSCLVDADFRDTESFYAKTEGYSVDRTWPNLTDVASKLIAAFDAYMAGKPKAEGAVNILRNAILEHVRGKAEASPG